MDSIYNVKAFLEGCVGAPYVYGATGRKCTPDYRRARMAQYPKYADSIKKYCPVLSGASNNCNTCKYKDKPAFDCAQLVRRAYQQADISLPSGASSQWLKGDWLEKGRVNINTKNTFCVVFRSGANPMKHVGICLGNGYVIDARGHRAGVIKSRFESYPWTHYAIPRGLINENNNKEENIIDIKIFQNMLIKAGYPLKKYGADGEFGSETRLAMQSYQQAVGLNISDTPNMETLNYLKDDVKPLTARVRDIEERLQNIEEIIQKGAIA